MSENTEATTDSTPPKDDSVATDGRTQEQLLADIVSNSDFVPNEEESLPVEQVPEVDPDESGQEDPKEPEESATEEIEEEIKTDEVDSEDEDADEESATQDTTIFTPEEIDLDAKLAIKIDGEEKEVSFSDLIKGYSTEQSLSKKGRELGDARKGLEEEYNKKLEEVQSMSNASIAILYKSEQNHAKNFHALEEKIEKARDEGDTINLSELKDKREQVQKQYWVSRREREALQKSVDEQSKKYSQEVWNEQINNFNNTIPNLIPDFNETVANDIRSFAIKEGINEQILDSVVDANIIKFINDYRILKEGINKGSAKRKSVASKKIPLKKSKSVSEKKVEASDIIRQKAFRKDSSKEDQMNFLRTYAERSLSNV